MIELFKSAEEKKYMSTFIDPFKSNKIESIWFWINKNWKGGMEFSSTTKFKNGDTQGEHKITADDFVTLVSKTENFIKSL